MLSGPKRDLLLIASLLWICGLVSANTDDLGCFKENPRDRVFKIHASNYIKEKLTISTCKNACQGYKYAALLSGKYCFCSDTYGKHGSSTGCTVKCPGKSTEVCGGQMSVSVHQATKVLQSIDMGVSGSGWQETRDPVSFSVNEETAVSYTYEYQDGTPPSSDMNSTHRFPEAGSFSVLATASNAAGFTVKDTKLVKVQSVVSEANLTCPEYILVNEKFSCMLEIADGSHMDAKVFWEKGSFITSKLPDAVTYHIGEHDGELSSGTNSLNYVYLMTNRIFRRRGTLVAFTTNIQTAGIIYIQVYRPKCAANTEFCYRSYSCIAAGASCRTQVNKWAYTCGGGAAYSLSAQACISKTDNAKLPRYMDTMWYDLPIRSYKLVFEFQYTAVKTGAQYIHVPDDKRFKVQQGDVLAVMNAGGVIGKTSTPVAYEYVHTRKSTWSSRLSTEYVIDGTPTQYFGSHLLRAYCACPVRFRFPHKYNKVGYYNVTAVVKNKLTVPGRSATVKVDVQSVIQNITLTSPPLWTTNKSVTFRILAHAGSRVNYTFSFGDGQSQSCLPRWINHVYSSAGVYSTDVTASNYFSNDTDQVTLIIQDTVEDANLVTVRTAAIFQTTTRFQWNISQGTNVSLYVDFGDGDSAVYNTKSDIDQIDSSTEDLKGWFDHNYTSIGNFTVVMNVSNLVGWKTVTIYAQVQIPISGFTIEAVEAIPHGSTTFINLTMATGSHVTFTSSFGGKETRIFNMSDVTHKGWAKIEPPDYPGIGNYTFTVIASNLIGPPSVSSTTLWVDYPITDMAVSVSQTCELANLPITFVISVTRVSRSHLWVDYGDGKTETVARESMLSSNSDNITLVHSYARAGFYKINITMVNPLGSKTVIKYVNVQNTVHKVSIASDSPCKILPNAKCNVTFTVSRTGLLLPTNATVVYDFGDSTPLVDAPFMRTSNAAVKDTHPYVKFGTYTVRANVSNCASESLQETNVTVDQPITGLQMNVSKLYVLYDTSVTVEVSMNWGSRFSLTWNFGDSTPPKTVQYDRSLKNYMGHTYNKIGTFLISATAKNVHGSYTTSPAHIRVTVQHPIKCFRLAMQNGITESDIRPSIWLKTVYIQLFFNMSCTFATSPSYKLDWQTGGSKGSGILTKPNPLASRNSDNEVVVTTLSKVYSSGGTYKITMRITNLVDDVSINCIHHVYEFVTTLSITVYYSAVDGKLQGGKGSNKNFFPLERPIIPHAAHSRGSHVVYNFQFGDSTSASFRDKKAASHQYKEPGTYDIFLNASNPRSFQTKSTKIKVQRSVQKIFIWIDGPRPRNTTVTFDVNLGSIGTEACYLVDFKDELSSDSRFLFFGHKPRCSKAHPNEWRLKSRRFIKYNDAYLKSVSGRLTVLNMFQTIGTHFINLTGSNDVSTVTFRFKMGVTRGVCYWPLVDLQTPNKCQGDTCTSIPNIPEKVNVWQKSRAFYVGSLASPNCSSSKTLQFYWKVFVVNEGDFSRSKQLNLSSITKTNRMRTLLIPPLSLQIGLHEFCINVSMPEEVEIYTEKCIYWKIRKSDLRASFEQGSDVRKKWGVNTTLSLANMLVDPDFPGNTDGFTCKWYCKRQCEDWQFDGIAPDPTSYKSFCNYSIGALDDGGGCMVADGLDKPGIFVDSTNCSITFDSSLTRESDSIDVVAVIFKDTRTTKAEISVEVIQGDPPDIFLNCFINCYNDGTMNKLDPDARFSLTLNIKNWRKGVKYNYVWELFKIVGRKHLPIDTKKWVESASTGFRGQNMALENTFFTASDAGSYFKYQARAWRGFDSFNYGKVGYVFQVNPPPSLGNITVSPSNGTAFGTLFTVKVTKDFEDADTPLVYHVCYGEKPDVTCPATLASFNENGMTLPPGNSGNDYESSVGVRACDRVGSCTLVMEKVQVTPASTEAMLGKMDELFQDGAIDTSDVAGTTSLLTNAAEMLASINPGDLDEKAKEKMVSSLLTSCSGVSSNLQRPEEASNLASTVMKMTSSSTELSEEGESAAAGALVNCMDVISSTSGEMSANGIESATTNILSAVGNLFSSASPDTASALQGVVNQIGGAVEKAKVPGEKATSIKTSNMEMEVEKPFTEELNGATYGGESGTSCTIGNAMDMIDQGNETAYFVQVSAVASKGSPYASTNESGTGVKGSTSSLSLKNETGHVIPVENCNEPIIIELKADPSAETNWTAGSTAPGNTAGKIHKVSVDADTALLIFLKEYVNESDSDTAKKLGVTKFTVYVRLDGKPSAKKFDFNLTLPLTDDEFVRLVRMYKPKLNDSEILRMTSNIPDRNSFVFISDEDFNLTSTTTVRILVKSENFAESVTDSKSQEKSNSPQSVEYLIQFRMIKCQYLCLDETTQELRWSGEGLTVGPLTNKNKTQCISCHLKNTCSNSGKSTSSPIPSRRKRSTSGGAQAPEPTFGAGFTVPMNSIDLSDSAFLKLAENPVVFGTMVSLMCMYLVLVIWARKADKDDLVKAGTTPLVDNDPRDKYLYEILVYTGARKNAATTSTVRFIMTGDQADTGARLMMDGKRPVLQRGAVDTFTMAVSSPLGALLHLRLWHDNSGKSPGWFFSRMQITDMQTDEKFFFIADRWLAVEEDDGMIDRILPVAGKEELTSFDHLFWVKTRKSLTDGHIYFSVFSRPPKSRFTRVQRLTCCICLLFCTMMANILFYNTDSDQPDPVSFKVGPISFSLTQVVVGAISAAIVVPVNIIIVFIFRNSAEPPSKDKRLNEKAKKAGKYLVDESSTQEKADFAIDELEKQKDYLETGNEANRLLLTSDVPPQDGVSFISKQKGVAKVSITGKKPEKKKKFQLPFWCLYIGYAISLGTVGTAFFMTVEVAGGFGKEKATEWLIAFTLSVCQSVLVIEPVKIMAIALFYALIIKKPDTEEEENPDLKKDEMWLHDHATEKDMEDPNSETSKKLARLKCVPEPPDQEYLNTVRKKRQKEIQMQKILREIASYLLFLYLLLTVSYGNRDKASFPVMTSCFHTFRDAQYAGSIGFQSIRSREHFWKWTQDVFLPSVYAVPGIRYSEEDWSSNRGFIADRNAWLVGAPRLRQLRIHSKPCLRGVAHISPTCRSEYSLLDQEKGEFTFKWKPVNHSDPQGDADAPFRYKTSSETGGQPYVGLQATYGGGGYVAELGKDFQTANQTLLTLIDNNWIDRRTRGVFVEFVIYNSNLNLFAVSLSVVEFMTVGGADPFFRMHVMRLDRYSGEGMLVVMGAEIVTGLFILFFIVREIKNIFKQKREYFKGFWNVTEFTVVCLCIGAIVMLLYRILVAVRLSNRIHDSQLQGGKFVNFQSAVFWDEMYGYLMAFIVFLANIKFIRLLRFNKNMSIMGTTLKYTGSSLLQFLMVFMVVFMAFAQILYVMFGSTVMDFATFIVTLETLFSLMLNKFNYGSIAGGDSFWGPTIFFFYTIFVNFLMVNFLLTIIMDGFARVKEELKYTKNEYEIVDFMVEKFGKLTGLGKKEARQGRPAHVWNGEPEYIPVEHEQYEPVEILETRLDVLLKKLAETASDGNNDDDVSRTSSAEEKTENQINKNAKRKIKSST